MTNTELLAGLLNDGRTAYMKDDFYEIAIRIAGPTETYLKHKGRGEVRVPYDYETLNDVILGGEFISREEYESF